MLYDLLVFPAYYVLHMCTYLIHCKGATLVRDTHILVHKYYSALHIYLIKFIATVKDYENACSIYELPVLRRLLSFCKGCVCLSLLTKFLGLKRNVLSFSERMAFSMKQ